RVSARDLQAAIKQESQIYLPLLDHTYTLSEQIAQAAICYRFHTTDQRLARWLLLARDRTRYGAFNLTRGYGADTGCFAQRGQFGGRPATNERVDPLCARPYHPSQSQRT